MKTKTSHSWRNLQDFPKAFSYWKEYNKYSKLTKTNTKDFPEWVIIPIAIGGFLAFYYLGTFVDWLLNLQTILN